MVGINSSLRSLVAYIPKGKAVAILKKSMPPMALQKPPVIKAPPKLQQKERNDMPRPDALAMAALEEYDTKQKILYTLHSN